MGRTNTVLYCFKNGVEEQIFPFMLTWDFVFASFGVTRFEEMQGAPMPSSVYSPH
jgi:hypothetical protein